MKNVSIKISFILNIIIFIMVVFSCVVMFTGIKFMYGHEIALDVTRFEMLKFFTVESNILMGIIALLFAFQEYKVITKKIKTIDSKYYLLKLMSTSAVSLTFFVVFAYLGNIAEYGLPSLLMNGNLFLHLITPVTSILTFIILERTSSIKFKSVIWGILPTILYGIGYLTNVLIHMENGRVSLKYDFYWFVQGNVKTAVIVAPMIFGISYLISLVLWFFNKKSLKK